MFDQLDSLNYRELQKLAKNAGVKANLPKGELLQALKESTSRNEDLDKEANHDEIETANEEGTENSAVDKQEAAANNSLISELDKTFDKTDVNAVEAEALISEDEDSHPGDKRRSARLSSVGTPQLKRTSTFVIDEENDKRDSVISKRQSTGRRSSIKNILGSSGSALTKRGSVLATPSSAMSKKKSLSGALTPAQSSAIAKRKSIKYTPSSAKQVTPRVARLSMKASGSTVKKSSVKMSASLLAATVSSSKKTQNEQTGLAKSSTSLLPRFVKYARKVPDFAKMHEKQFDKMESLDTYMERKNKISEQQKKKTQNLNEEHSKLMEIGRSLVGNSQSSFKPSALSTANLNFNFGAAAGGYNGSQEPFRFSATSVSGPVTTNVTKRNRNINVKALTRDRKLGTGPRFAKPVAAGSPKPPPSTGKKMAAKTTTPSVNRKLLSATSTPSGSVKKQHVSSAVKSSGFKARHSVGVATPQQQANPALQNITNRSLVVDTPSSAAKKKTFDLKASLAKPLSYRPHTGKLKAWGADKKVDVKEMHQSSTKEMLEKTRNFIKGVRMNKRAALLMKARKMD